MKEAKKDSILRDKKTSKPLIVCIVGPTASGKTSLAVDLAKEIDAEVISADSMQIYKEVHIATAKVTKEETKGIPHHLIDICSIKDKFSVADFKKMCYDKIDDIISRGKNVVIAGGTGLYVSAIVDDMNFTDEVEDTNYREYLYSLANLKSKEYVYEMLKNIDSKTAQTIHPNNLKRVIRALEIAKNSNILKSEYIKLEKQRIDNVKISDENSKYIFKVIYIDYDRKTLYDRINKRVDIMVDEGLIDEAKMVYDMNLNKDLTIMQAIGYKEFFEYFKGNESLDVSIERLKQETRKYSKRQETWFKNKLDIIKIDGNLKVDEKLKKVKEILNL